MPSVSHFPFSFIVRLAIPYCRGSQQRCFSQIHVLSPLLFGLSDKLSNLKNRKRYL